MLLTFSLSNYASAKDKGYEVLRNDDFIAEVLVHENGEDYIASMNKETKEITFKTDDANYDVILDEFQTNEDGTTSIAGKIVNQDNKEVLDLSDFNNKENSNIISPRFVFAYPLVLGLTAALEALLLTEAVIVVGGATYVLVSELSDHLSKNRKFDYFAAYRYYFRDEGKSRVVIGPGISKAEAEGRLMMDADTFARTKSLARSIFQKLERGPEIHGDYPDYLYHYHGYVPNENKPGKNILSDRHSFYLGIN
ncbi:hypothetical protein JNUCC42_19910 [Brevibacterium sp. JNUCC-42]|nr:hypothetical protein JNUCC42_19910 [Brevibacterium sp. JNUCC-42]